MAYCQRKTIQDIAATTVQLFDNMSKLLKKAVEQLCQPVQALGKAAFERKSRSHVMGAQILNSYTLIAFE